MDAIAGSVGFYDALFRPALDARIRVPSDFTFDAVDEIRPGTCPEASFQATLSACVSRTAVPTLYLEAEMAYKKREQEQLKAG